MTQRKPQDSGGWPWLFDGIRTVNCAGALRDALAGFTLAAMNVPQVLGHTRIAGTPVVTGLYSLLLPLVAFAALGSSRYLVVAIRRRRPEAAQRFAFPRASRTKIFAAMPMN